MSAPPSLLLEELHALIAAVIIRTPQEILFADRPVGLGPPEWPAAFPPPLPPMLRGLHHQLYYQGYCGRFAGTLRAAPRSGPPAAPLTAALAAANPGAPRLDPGWRVVGPGPGGQTWLQKEGLGHTAWAGAWVTSAALDRAPQPGDPAELFWPHESWLLQPGVYFAFGAAIPDSVADAHWLRFYWHSPPAAAPRLLAVLVQALNRFQVPFRCKCPAHAPHYDRRDALVLSISRRDYRLAAQLVARIHAEFQEELDADTPLFTRRLAPGLALAEDPGTAESFGQHRCRLLAEALWQAYEQQIPPGAARLQAVLAYFAQAGIDPQRPHLNAGTHEDYPWPP
jgi:hypothetical protein